MHGVHGFLLKRCVEGVWVGAGVFMYDARDACVRKECRRFGHAPMLKYVTMGYTVSRAGKKYCL
jgi:hypothetical protein